jgi:hypothetical protein
MHLKQFKELPRNDMGDIINLYDVFTHLTEAQVGMLSSDDWMRVQEYEEETRIMVADFIKYELPHYKSDVGLSEAN